MKVALDPLDGEPVVVEESFPLSRKELPVRQRNDPPLLGLLDRLEFGGNEEDLPYLVVVVALSIIDELARARISKARRGVCACRWAQEVGERGDGEIRDEQPARREMRANAREKALDVASLVKMERRVERAHDQWKAPVKTDAPHVPTPSSDPDSNVGRLVLEALVEVLEHRRGVIDPGNGNPMTRDRQRDTTVSYAVLEHRAAHSLSEPDVELNVVDSLAIRRRVVVGVGIVRERARFELAVTATRRRKLLQKAFFVLTLDPLLYDVVARPVEMHLAGSNLAKSRDRRLVLRMNEGGGALHELTRSDRRQDDEGESVLFTLEAIFDGYTGHAELHCKGSSRVVSPDPPRKSYSTLVQGGFRNAPT